MSTPIRLVLAFGYALDRTALLVDVFAPRADDAVVGMCRQKGDLPLESFRMADVVGVHARDQRRAGFGQQLV